MTRFWWVRHGPTHEKRFVGWRDVPADLSDLAALERLNAYLPDTATLISSDLIRAVATADAVGEGRKRLPHDTRLREFNFGLWDGLGFDAVVARDPELSQAFWENPGDIAAPDGESWNDVALRVRHVIDELTTAGHQDVVAVAHIGVIMTQIQRAGGLSPGETLAHQIDNLSVTRLDWTGKGWQTGVINHLP